MIKILLSTPLRLLGVLLLVLGLGPAQAAAGADEVVRQTTETLRSDIRANFSRYQSDKAAFYTMVDGTVGQAFDTPYIAKIILGENIKGASAEQIAQFEDAFTSMLIRQYADQLLKYYDSVEIDVAAARVDGSGTKANVDTTIRRKDGPPLVVQFRLRQVAGEWKVWDLVAENISLVINFRTQVDAAIKRSNLGSVIDGLRNGTLTLEGQGESQAS